MAARSLSARKRRAFLAALAETGNVSAAAAMVGACRSGLYRVRQADPAFARAWADALEQAVEALEAEARRRAIEGVDRPVFYQGRLVGQIRTYSDALLMFLLRAYRPAVYRDRAGEDAAGEDGPLKVEIVRFSEQPDANPKEIP